MPSSEAPVEDADTLVVDTSILDMVPAPAVGASPLTGLSLATALGNTNQDAVSPASTQVFTHFPIYFLGFLYFSYIFFLQADASTEPTQPVVDTLPRRRFLLRLAPFNLSTPLVCPLNFLSKLVTVTLTQSLVLRRIRTPVRLVLTRVFLQLLCRIHGGQ